jgi:hypothetical protein
VLTEYGRDRVRRLRVSGLTGDSLATRRSMEHALAGVELTPRGLSSSAIVCVRRLRAERGRADSGSWVQGIQGRIAAIVAGGVRPYRDAVPADGTAVIFEDEAELLACLARDWREGRGATWWWTGLLGQPPSDELVRRVFTENARFVPAAIEILVEAGRAIDFVRALPDAFCSQLRDVVSIAFGVPAIQDQRSNETASVDQFTQDAAARPGASRGVGVVARAVMLASAPGDWSVLSSVQRHFLAAALLVRRSPVLARTAGIVAALSSSTISSLVSGSLEPASADARPLATDVPSASAESEARETREEPNLDRRLSEVPVVASASVSESPDVAQVQDVEAVEPHHIAEPLRQATPTDVSLQQVSTSEPFVTSFAGIFYLVNLAIHLELYADFTQPDRENPEMPVGRFLARTAESVCGEVVREDPIWPALTRLAEGGIESRRADDLSPVDRTIDDLLPGLERLAAGALQLPEGAALESLCRTSGRVLIGRTRLDVFFSLASHPIAIRIAGFDRNPGWLPAAGRVITFHYD